MPLLSPRETWPASVKNEDDPLIETFLNTLGKTHVNSHFSKILVDHTFLADFYILSPYSGRKRIFDDFSQLSESQEEQLDMACQHALETLLPDVAKMITVAQDYTNAREPVEVECRRVEKLIVEYEDAVRAAKRAELLSSSKKNQYQPAQQQDLVSKEELKVRQMKKPSAPKKPPGIFETACWKYIAANATENGFSQRLPHCLRNDQLFAVVLLECLFKLYRGWIVEALKKTPNQLLPEAPTLHDKYRGDSQHKVVDIDSEVHRFCASAIKVWMGKMKARYEKRKQIHEDKATKGLYINPTHMELQRTYRDAYAILYAAARRRSAIPSVHDQSYDSNVLKSLDKGGLLFVAPAFLLWAKELMKEIRAKVSKESIKRVGRHIQEKAYESLINNTALLQMFATSVKKGVSSSTEIEDDTIQFVHDSIVRYAFHARTGAVWKEFREEETCRSKGKDKKKTLREGLK